MLEYAPYAFASIGTGGVVAAMVLMYRELRARPVYVPRHRAIDGPSTMQQVAQRRRAALPAATQVAELLAGLGDRAGDQAELSRPGPRKGSYAKLRTAELDRAAERLLRVAEHKQRRRALTVRPVSPPWAGASEDLDVWDPIPEGVVGYAIAGGTR
jgi:hypothetical protein